MEPIAALRTLLEQAVSTDPDPAGPEPNHDLHGIPVASLPDALVDATVEELRPMAGGSINSVYRVTFSTGTVAVLKLHRRPPAGFFQAEADGLRSLRSALALRIPEVYAVGDNGILLEWLPEASTFVRRNGRVESGSTGRLSDPGVALGIGLAKQHCVQAQHYGYHRDNFIGLLPQKNEAMSSWTSFFRDCRLLPQFELAEELGRMTAQRRRWADRLMQRLPEWIEESSVTPSLLHGDLWGGNWLNTPAGPALIDPAVYYGDREMDLAMAALFGGFPRSFFASYADAYPLAPGWRERQPLYQLYYLLIHLNLFGEGYGGQVDAVLRRYGG